MKTVVARKREKNGSVPRPSALGWSSIFPAAISQNEDGGGKEEGEEEERVRPEAKRFGVEFNLSSSNFTR